MPDKIHIYFVPGLGASSSIFDFLKLPSEKFELHFLEWLIPESANEKLEHYVKRLIIGIKHPNPVLVGVSFGGIIVQEISRYIDTNKVIIISSIKDLNEIPKRMKIVKITKVYKLFPAKKIARTGDFSTFKFNKTIQKRIEIYNKYLNVRDENYLKWSIHNVLSWRPSSVTNDIVHIHGSKDEIFPIKYINDCIVIEGGTHVMILNKAKRISTILEDIF
jgi:pimeloyl-ACP methyl ester carboxylesterase